MIPRRLVRTVPTETSPQVEGWWEEARRLHPGWQHVTLRDPVDRRQFPISSPYWDEAESGAQLGDLIKTEELFQRGGVVIDSDVICWRTFEPLLGLDGWAAFEDAERIPNAVMAFTAGHPALQKVLELAIQRRDQGTWAAGVGVCTEVFHDRSDMVLLPPGSLYPFHWKQRGRVDLAKVRAENPWAYCAHMWHASWHNDKRSAHV